MALTLPEPSNAPQAASESEARPVLGVPADKWARKYLLQAAAIASDNDACLSRRIGCVIVSPDNVPLPTGYNGAARGLPHADSVDNASFVWGNLLSDDDVGHLRREHGCTSEAGFARLCVTGKTCPRRLLGCSSGERLDLCPCSHAERNAIYAAARHGARLAGATMYAACPLPCHECSVAIRQAGLSRVVCLATAGPDYSPTSRRILTHGTPETGAVEIVEVDPRFLAEAGANLASYTALAARVGGRD